jgi:outer membrane protein OmpA-like peptidoglycan-associated protein
MWKLVVCLAATLVAASTGYAEEEKTFKELVGDVTIGEASASGQISIPYITWGADVAEFYANGGLTTKDGTIFKAQGLDLKYTPGDDFIQQVRDYMEGKTPFLRGTMRMIGQASEVLGSDPRTKPVVLYQLSWSVGDHAVSPERVKTLNDLKAIVTGGKKVKVCLQRGGPHVGMADDLFKTAGISWDDVEVVWTDDLTGSAGPAAKMKADETIDIAFVISPDMMGLTGGLEQTGSGGEETLKGAHVLLSTATLSRSIADVRVVRSDFYTSPAGRAICDKLTAGVFKAQYDMKALRKAYEANANSADGKKYFKVLTMAQTIFGTAVLPSVEVDAAGLLMDCNMVGLTGNISFFTDEANLQGFKPKEKAALDLAAKLGLAKVRQGFIAPSLDYKKLAQLASIEYVEPPKTRERISGEFQVFPDTDLDKDTIVSFTIQFQPDQSTFNAEQYGTEFTRVIENASLLGNAVVVIRGHADPSKTLYHLVKLGLKKGTLKVTGTGKDRKYFYNGKPLDITATREICALIDKGEFDGDNQWIPRQIMGAALRTSHTRANAVRDALVAFAKTKGVTLDVTQLHPQGVGISDPLVPKPASAAEAANNMRVEFRIIKVSGESLKESEFDF